jgi:hypothetical protein
MSQALLEPRATFLIGYLKNQETEDWRNCKYFYTRNLQVTFLISCRKQ